MPGRIYRAGYQAGYRYAKKHPRAKTANIKVREGSLYHRNPLRYKQGLRAGFRSG